MSHETGRGADSATAWSASVRSGEEDLLDVVTGDLLASTKVRLRVHREIDPNTFPAGIKLADAEPASVNIGCHEFHGNWNYTIKPSYVTR